MHKCICNRFSKNLSQLVAIAIEADCRFTDLIGLINEKSYVGQEIITKMTHLMCHYDVIIDILMNHVI
jgi:hypothetical protein